MRKRRKGIYILPNLFTLGGAVRRLLRRRDGDERRASTRRPYGVFCAMVLDSLDGRVARMTNTQSAFGEQMDSLSDMVSFGAAPALIAYEWALKGLGTLGLDRGLRLLRLRRAAPGALQHQHRRGRQALLPGPAAPAAAALVTGFIWLMNDYGLHGGDEGVARLGRCSRFTLYAGLTMVTNVPFYSFKDMQHEEERAVRRHRR